MERVLVSVIIPVYNTEKYLSECLRSVMSQTLKKIEIICVEDGSTDSSQDIIKQLQKEDARIKLLLQENRGGGAARNLALEQAVGNYLMFLDSDDFFEPEMLEKMYRKCEKMKADICVCKVRCYHEDLGFDTEEPGAMREHFLPEKECFSWQDMPDYIFNTFHNWPWNKMFRRALIEKHKLRFQEIKRTNDLFFTCQALVLAERITTLKEVLVSYRVGISGNCQSTNVETPLDFYEAFKQLKEELLRQGIFEAVKRSFVNHALDGCLANLNSQEGGKYQEQLYEQLKDNVFAKLSIEGQEADYFYDFNRLMYRSYRIIMEEDYPAFLRDRIQNLKDERDYCLRTDHREKMQLLYELENFRDRKIYELENSRDQKIGRVVLALPRVCLKLVRKIKGNIKR